MSSQEEYLDKLLNDLTDDLTKEMTEEDFLSNADASLVDEMILADEVSLAEEIPLTEEIQEPSVEEISLSEEMSLDDDIFLEEVSVPVNEEGTDELMSLLENSQDEELLEIQDMLQKADNNEPIDDDIVTLLESIPDETSEAVFPEEDLVKENFEENDEEVDHLVDDLLDDISAGAALAGVLQEDIANSNFVSESQKKAEEKKQQRAAQKEAKKAEKEAKKAEKLAQKEAKKVEKAAQKEAKKAELAARKEAKKAAEEQQNSVEDSEEIIKEAALPTEKMDDDIFSVGLDDLLADIPDITNMSEANDNISNSDSGVKSISEEDDIFAGIASLDLFGEADMETGGLDALTDSLGEDSLAQIIDDEKKAKRKGFFSRFIEFITEEDEENEDVPISEENREILNEMDKEGKKKKKDKKLKKGKKGESAEGEAENGAEDEAQDEKKKKKKEKKPKKEKAPKIVVEEPNGKKLSPKRVVTILGICLSICLVIVVCTYVVGDFSVKKAGRGAYYEEDYQTCYQNFYGKHLNESEQVMYSKSESILTMRMWIREYELLVEEGSELEALDSLLQSVYDYPKLYAYAVEWNAGTEVAELYNHILAILSEKYLLTEAQAKEIANTPNDVEYTKMVMAVIAGEAYGSWNRTEENGKDIEVLPDKLPEEVGLGEAAFVDNKSAK